MICKNLQRGINGFARVLTNGLDTEFFDTRMLASSGTFLDVRFVLRSLDMAEVFVRFESLRLTSASILVAERLCLDCQEDIGV